MIKEKLGHKKISTTESYLGSFEKEIEDKYLDKLWFNEFVVRPIFRA